MKITFLALSVFIVLCQCPDILAVEDDIKASTRTPSYTRSGSESCLPCHSGEKMRAVLGGVHGNPDVRETPAATHGCESCHGKGSIHISRAHGGKGFPKLTVFGSGKRGSPREEKLSACLSCHGSDTAVDEAGITQTFFTGSAHDRPTINCSNCHEAHVESDPMGDIGTQTKACSRCHKGDINRHPSVKGEAVDMDVQACSSCHNIHYLAKKNEE